MKIRLILVLALIAGVASADTWDKLQRTIIENTLGDKVGVTDNRLNVQLQDNADVVITDGSEDAAVLNTGSNDSLAVAIVDSSGNQIESFGGGVQYTEGDTDATITGTAMIWEDSGDTLRVVSSTHPLPVDITDSTIAVTQSGAWDIGTVTSITNDVNIADGGNSITVDGNVATTAQNIGTSSPTVYNVTMTDADTEYSQALTNVKSLMFQCRGEYDIRYAFVPGKVATPTAPWMTLKAGAVYSEEFLDGAADFTLYIACGTAGQIVEIEVK